MRSLKIVAMVLGGVLLTGCGSTDGDTSETVSDTTYTTTSEDTTQGITTDTTDDISTEGDITTVTDTTTDITTDTQQGGVSTTAETSTSDVTTNIETTTKSDTTSDTTNDTESEILAELIVPTHCDSEYITDEICKEISEYFYAMKIVDTETFLDKQLPEYNSFMDNYLQENSSSVQDMLQTYHDNILKSYDSTAETTPYTSVDFNSIELVYPNDFDSIMNTMTYINQLDDMTLEYGEYTLSDELSAYYELQYTIDYTLHGDSAEDYNSTNSGNILVMVKDEQIFLIMLS